MPIYQYECKKCGNEEDRLVSFSNANEQVCNCDENAPLVRKEVVNQLNFALKGNWFKNRGTY